MNGHNDESKCEAGERIYKANDNCSPVSRGESFLLDKGIHCLLANLKDNLRCNDSRRRVSWCKRLPFQSERYTSFLVVHRFYEQASIHGPVDPRTTSVAGNIGGDTTDWPSITCSNTSMACDMIIVLSRAMVVKGGVV